MELKCAPEVEASIFSGSYKASTSVYSNIGSIQCPVAIGTGNVVDPTNSFNAQIASALASQLPNARLERYVA